MKHKASKPASLLIESLNYIILNYALSNMILLFWHSWLFIPFFASEFWLMERFWKRLEELTESRILSRCIWIVCFAVHLGIDGFGGRVVGEILPFSL